MEEGCPCELEIGERSLCLAEENGIPLRTVVANEVRFPYPAMTFTGGRKALVMVTSASAALACYVGRHHQGQVPDAGVRTGLNVAAQVGTTP